MTKKRKNQEREKGQGLFFEQEIFKSMIEKMVQDVLKEQVNNYMGVGRYQRSADRMDYRNGYKPRTMKTRVGKLEFSVPQVRSGEWQPSVFERYQRSEKALICAMREMVIHGVSTRKVSAILEEMSGFEVSASLVSKTMLDIDEEIERFKHRSLGDETYPYLIVDARYENIRQSGVIVKKAFLIVAGINSHGMREILDFGLGDSESEYSWGEIFSSLKKRGIQGTKMIVSDAHSGIKKALSKHFQGIAWQRCKVHFVRELLNRVSYRDRQELAKDIKSVFLCDQKHICMVVAEEVSDKWLRKAPKVSKLLLEGVEDCLTYKSLTPCHQRKLSSTNMLERVMEECKRRSKVVNIFPNDESCMRYLGAILIEMHEEWMRHTGSGVYLPMSMENEAKNLSGAPDR
jgi:transposase-like protein